MADLVVINSLASAYIFYLIVDVFTHPLSGVGEHLYGHYLEFFTRYVIYLCVINESTKVTELKNKITQLKSMLQGFNTTLDHAEK